MINENEKTWLVGELLINTGWSQQKGEFKENIKEGANIVSWTLSKPIEYTLIFE